MLKEDDYRLDYLKTQKFKKNEGYDKKLEKLLDKATKTKPGKQDIRTKSKGDEMTFKSIGKKPSPLNTLDYSKIKKLHKSSPIHRAVALALPGPNEKNRTTLVGMRFKTEQAYDYYVEKMESRGRSPTRTDDITYDPKPSETPQYRNSTPGSVSRHTEKTRSSRRHHTRSPSYSPSIISSSRSSSLSHSRRASRSRHHGVESYISTDGAIPHARLRTRSDSPYLTINSPFETSYVTTSARFRDSPMNRYYYQSSDSSSSYSSSDEYASDSESYTSSSDYSSDSDIPNGRAYIISRCREDGRSNLKCKPVGSLKVSRDTPSFYYSGVSRKH